jgi:hypothetical protein
MINRKGAKKEMIDKKEQIEMMKNKVKRIAKNERLRKYIEEGEIEAIENGDVIYKDGRRFGRNGDKYYDDSDNEINDSNPMVFGDER